MKYIRKYQQGDPFKGLNNLVGLATYSVPPDASGHVSDMNCIGSACMALKKAGVDIPIIPGNSNFWDQAQRGQIPVKVYITRADERASRLNKIQKGDIMGHDRPGKWSRNKYFPEHSNIVYDVLRDADGNITTVRTLDGYGDKFSIKDYSYDELEKGGPYGNLFVGRPTLVNGELNPADFSVRGNTRDIPENLNETISNTWYNLDPNKTAGLSNYQTNTALNIAKIGSNLKKDFITKTGISNDKYDKLVQMLVGVSGQESNYGVTATKEGNNVLKYGLKNRLRTDYENVKDSLAKVFVKEGPSRGVLQVKDRNIFKNPGTNKLVSEFGITKHNYNPDDLKQNVVMALALLNNIDLHQLPGFNSPKTKKVKEFKGRKNNWLARRAASNYVQTEYTTHNDPDLPYEQKMLYYYNRPRTVKRGGAQGDNIYIKNVIEGSKLIYPQKSSLITLPVVNIIGAKTNATNATNATNTTNDTTDEFDFGPQPYAYQSGGVLSGPTIRGRKYPAGTVITNDPNDPRLRAYQDSLTLHNITPKLQELEYKSNRAYKRLIESGRARADQSGVLIGTDSKYMDDFAKAVDETGAFMRKYGIEGGNYTSNIYPSETNPHYRELFDMGDDVEAKNMGQLLYKKPIVPIIYAKSDPPISILTPKGMPIPTVTPNQGLRPDVIYTERPDGHRKQGLSISHRTDPLGRWAAQINTKPSPGVDRRLTTFPEGTHKVEYRFENGGIVPIAQDGWLSKFPPVYKSRQEADAALNPTGYTQTKRVAYANTKPTDETKYQEYLIGKKATDQTAQKRNIHTNQPVISPYEAYAKQKREEQNVSEIAEILKANQEYAKAHSGIYIDPQTGKQVIQNIGIKPTASPIDAAVLGVGALASGGMGLLGSMTELANPIGFNPFKQAYKLNPWAFKPNPEMMYRGIGKSGYKDAIESGVLRARPSSQLPPRDLSMHPLIKQKVFDKVYYTPAEKMHLLSKQYGNGYIAEVPKVGNNFRFRYGKDKPWSQLTEREIPISEAKLYKEHWLQGYKEIPKKENGGGWLPKIW